MEALAAADLFLDFTASDALLRAVPDLGLRPDALVVSASVGLFAERLYLFADRAERFTADAFDRWFAPYRQREHERAEREGLPQAAGCWHPVTPVPLHRLHALAGMLVERLDQIVAADAGARLRSHRMAVSWVPCGRRHDRGSAASITWPEVGFRRTMGASSSAFRTGCRRVSAGMAASFAPLETGGLLLGRYGARGAALTVGVALPPPPDSLHGRYDFVRGTEGLRRSHRAGTGSGPYVVRGRRVAHAPGARSHSERGWTTGTCGGLPGAGSTAARPPPC